MQQALERITVVTHGLGFYEISGKLTAWLNDIGARDGLLTVLVRHTSASLLVQGNDDPALWRDLLARLDALAPMRSDYAHNNEGAEDVPGHIKSMLTAVQLSIPVEQGKMLLGRLQGVFLLEHRSGEHRREVVLHFVGEM